MAALESAVERQSEGMQQAMQAVAEALQALATQRAGPDEILAAEVRKLRDEVRMLTAQELEDVEDDCPETQEGAR